jgi:H+/Cl- antiporter ClcA
LKHYKYKEYIANVFPCIYYGIICGSVTGAFIFLFKIAANKITELSQFLYSESNGNWIYIALIFSALIAFALLMYAIHRKAPEIKGGGIPRSEGVLRGLLHFRWLKTLLGTFFGSMLSFLCGLPLGSEGPAVLMGTSVGCMCGSISKNKTTWNRYIMTGGAGAGFAVATGSPLSGILFALEEIHKRFTPMLVLTVSVSVVSATYTNSILCAIFSIDPRLLHIEGLNQFDLGQIGYLLLLGVIIALGVGIFDSSIDIYGRFTAKFPKTFSPVVKLISLFLLTGVLCFFFKNSVGNV